MVDNIMMEFRCKECDVDFPTQSSVNSHMEEVHNSVRDQELIQEVIHQEKKAEVIPDENFLTQNTADLKALLESIPQEILNYDEDVFEKDFKEILNSTQEEYDKSDMSSFKCK